ncbi:hypothetical protein KCU61_g50, partial [Aureobasidium melanogenum]
MGDAEKNTTSKAVRKNASNACKGCRESKIKTENVSMILEMTREGLKLTLTRVQLRTAVHILVRRVQQLSKVIIEADREIPPLDAEDEDFLERVLGTLGLSDAPPYESSAAKNSKPLQRFPSNQTTSTPEAPQQTQVAPSAPVENDSALVNVVSTDTPVSGQYYQPDFNNVTGMMPVLDRAISGYAAPNDNPTRVYTSDEENTELVNQLSAPTILWNRIELTSDRQPEVNVQRLLEVADLSQTVDIQLEDHLLRLFFTWHNPSSYIVDEEVFYMARQSWFNTGVQNSYYNDVLKDAMCAIGASFGNHSNMSLITYPRSMPQFFSDRAKILLDSHLDSPCVATAQALVILASYEESCQNIARGWLFGGMAMRIAFDLGLHVDSAGYVAQGILTVAEARARQVAFWGCYLSNLLWSFHLGRPFSLDDSEVTVPKPDPKTLPSNPTWQPYSIPSLQFVPGAMHDASQLPDITPQIFHHWIFLCQNIAVVGHALYSYTSISKPALQELCEETTTELFHWKDSLPPHLQIDTSDTATVKLPQLLMLHMEYHHLQIFLHRPWTSSQLQPQPLQGAGVHHARHVCATSATEIARLLRIYENQYTFRFINVEIIRILSSAALILIFATVPLPHREIDVEMTGYLNTCFRALEDLGGRYDSAKETRCTLLAIQRRWNDLYGRNTGQKRGPSMRGSTSQGKRVRAAPFNLTTILSHHAGRSLISLDMINFEDPPLIMLIPFPSMIRNPYPLDMHEVRQKRTKACPDTFRSCLGNDTETPRSLERTQHCPKTTRLGVRDIMWFLDVAELRKPRAVCCAAITLSEKHGWPADASCALAVALCLDLLFVFGQGIQVQHLRSLEIMKCRAEQNIKVSFEARTRFRHSSLCFVYEIEFGVVLSMMALDMALPQYRLVILGRSVLSKGTSLLTGMDRSASSSVISQSQVLERESLVMLHEGDRLVVTCTSVRGSCNSTEAGEGLAAGVLETGTGRCSGRNNCSWRNGVACLLTERLSQVSQTSVNQWLTAVMCCLQPSHELKVRSHFGPVSSCADSQRLGFQLVAHTCRTHMAIANAPVNSYAASPHPVSRTHDRMSRTP